MSLKRSLPALLLPALLSMPANAEPALRQPHEQWEAARRKVAQDEDWRRWLQREREALAAWMAAPRDSEDWSAGWIHDFQDARTGAFSAWTPATDCNAAAPRESRSWRGCLALQRQHHMRMLRAAARLATLTGERRHAEWAGRQLDLYARLYERRAAGRAPDAPVLFAQLLDEATMMPLLADTVRLLRPMADAQQPRRWCDSLLLPMARRLAAAQKEVHNIAVWHSAAVAIAGMECGQEEAMDQALRGPWSLSRLLQQGMSDDGFWFELSLSYQYYVAQALNEALLAAALRGRLAEFAPLAPALRGLFLSPFTVQFDGGDTPLINDANNTLRLPDDTMTRAVRRLLPTAAGVRLALAQPDWDLLLDPPDAQRVGLDPLPEAKQLATHEAPGLKSLYLRSGEWQALLRIGQGARFHAHQDGLTVELKHGDTWLLRNSATPAYGSELHRLFYKLAAAKNTPLVNYQGTSNWFAAAAESSAGAQAIDASYKSFQYGVKVRRRLAVREGALEDRLEFNPASPAANAAGTSVGMVYHSDCMASDAPAAAVDPAPLPAAPGFSYLTPSRSWPPDRSWQVRLDCAGKPFSLRLSGSEAFQVTLATAPALKPPRQRTALIVAMAAAPGAWLAASFAPLSPRKETAR
ncbi:Heparinase II/III-like protein [Noviherbaspirillum humi]|uniref:Heparinase II/III-like protein n=1 Tax=Noviherbaspirillum humi TaxID=1688639 RepID=A0A239C3H6_9BURK|nr:heparinase II/III family protein [Noviherbaspirillum humi]SNS14462.1 Heparinase II/III-like protein [Noviherbaspirillum humi]